jgi:5'-methylthioadenosine phosphorylase
MSINIAVIGGTNMGDMLGKGSLQPAVFTPFGTASYFTLMVDGMEIIFVDRHHLHFFNGDPKNSFRPPDRLNHRAYMWALAEAGVKFVIATSAVGGINGPNDIKNLAKGSIGMPVDFIDLVQKPYTFAYGGGLVHETAFHRSPADMFCTILRSLVADRVDCPTGILSCVQGPRYETHAEALILRDVYHVNFAGMTTAVPEAILAREAAMHYLLLANVTNMLLEGDSPADGKEVQDVIAEQQPHLSKVIRTLIHILHGAPPEFKCECIKDPSVFEMCGYKF